MDIGFNFSKGIKYAEIIMLDIMRESTITPY